MSLSDAQTRPRRRSSSLEKRDPYSAPSVYYDEEESIRKQLLGHRNRAVSSVCLAPPPSSVALH